MNRLTRLMPHRLDGTVIAGLLALALILAFPGSAPAQNLAEALLERAPEIREVLEKAGYQNVGVLKFAVKTGADSSERDNRLSVAMADRLTLALIVSSNDGSKPQMIWNASEVAAKIKGADHKTEEGRAKLFAAPYPLAGERKKVNADAFITGTVELTANLEKLVVNFEIIAAMGRKPPPQLKPLEVSTDISALLENGDSFLLCGIEDAKLRSEALKRAQEMRKKKPGLKCPLDDPDSPVVLKICYDGKEQKPKPGPGGLFLDEPKEKQNVVFRLERKDWSQPPEKRSKSSYGVVLKVNGKNTLYRETLPDVDCSKWVLDPCGTALVIKGFQIKDSKAEAHPFAVLSEEESKERESRYGSHLGQISLTVFRDTESELHVESLAIAIDRGSLPKVTGLSTIKKSLQDQGVRGILEQGTSIVDSPILEARIKVFPIPVMAATVTYYLPTSH